MQGLATGQKQPIASPRLIPTLGLFSATMLVAGGGVIGCEYACMFAALGIKVFLVEGRERLLGFMDEEISHCLADCMKRMGIDLHMPASLESVNADASLHVRLKSGMTLNVHKIGRAHV